MRIGVLGTGMVGSTSIDLGDITTARRTEMVLPLWLRLMVAFKTPMFNFHIVRAPAS